MNNVFMKLGGEGDGYAAVSREFIADVATVVVPGEYSGTYKATGKSFEVTLAGLGSRGLSRAGDWNG